MSPMSDQPLTLGVLAQFYREIVAPDIERIVLESEFRLRDQMRTLYGDIIVKLDEIASVRPGAD